MNIAIIIPIKNQHQHLMRCLHSVENQLNPGDVVLVVNDNEALQKEPSSECLATLKEFHKFTSIRRPNDEFIPFVHLLNLGSRGCDSGVSSARNYGAGYLTGLHCEWIKFLDADDELAPHALDTFRALELDPEIKVVSGSMIRVIDGLLEKAVAPNFEQIKFSNPTLVSNSFIRRTGFEEVGKFNEVLEFEEDWELWLRFMKMFGMECFATVDFPVCYYNIINAERAAKVRKNTIVIPDTKKPTGDGGFETIEVDVREYFRRVYGTKA